MYTTIRKNSLKQIRKILEAAVLIKYYYDDGQDAQTGTATVDEIMAKAERFRRVSTDDNGCLHISIGGSYFFDAYPSAEAARKQLTPEAFEKYFGTKAAA